jgi:hypothetical protein
LTVQEYININKYNMHKINNSMKEIDFEGYEDYLYNCCENFYGVFKEWIPKWTPISCAIINSKIGIDFAFMDYMKPVEESSDVKIYRASKKTEDKLLQFFISLPPQINGYVLMSAAGGEERYIWNMLIG